MLLSDVIEEIVEKVGEGPGRSLSMQSLVRKVDMKVKEIRRLYGRNDDDMAVMDILNGIAEYPLPCAPGNITSVYVNNNRMTLRSRNDYSMQTYYYLLDGTIGLYMAGKKFPDRDFPQGLKIFHKHMPSTLTINDLNAPPDIEEDFRMLPVYGVLIDICEPGMINFYQGKYNSMLADYVAATRDPESTQISGVYTL